MEVSAESLWNLQLVFPNTAGLSFKLISPAQDLGKWVLHSHFYVAEKPQALMSPLQHLGDPPVPFSDIHCIFPPRELTSHQLSLEGILILLTFLNTSPSALYFLK